MNDNRSSQTTANTSSGQQLFSYKMANSFQNPVTTMSGVTVSTSNSPVAYDYRLGMSTMVARPGDPATMATTAANTQWWYASGQNAVENTLQQQQQQAQQQAQQLQQQLQQHNVHTPPPQVSNW
jgi:high mobility group protein B1